MHKIKLKRNPDVIEIAIEGKCREKYTRKEKKKKKTEFTDKFPIPLS